MNPFSRRSWKREANRAAQGRGSILWDIAGFILLLVIVKTILEALFK